MFFLVFIPLDKMIFLFYKTLTYIIIIPFHHNQQSHLIRLFVFFSVFHRIRPTFKFSFPEFQYLLSHTQHRSKKKKFRSNCRCRSCMIKLKFAMEIKNNVENHMEKIIFNYENYFLFFESRKKINLKNFLFHD